MPSNTAPHIVNYDKIPIKTPQEIAMLREAGKVAARVLEELSAHIQPGVTKHQLNDIAYDLIVKKHGCEIDREDLTGYDSSPYACVSFAHNEIAFNGEADSIPLRKGDLFGIDISLKKEKWCGDTSRQWIVGEETSAKARLLSAVANQAMCLGISLVRPGAKVQDIAERVQQYVEKHGFNMLRVSSATGHSIGLHHADGWHIPFYHDSRNEGRVLQEGMVITIEPFVGPPNNCTAEGPADQRFKICAGNGAGTRLPNVTKTAVTKDHSLAAYWEHVVAVTKEGCEVLDLREGEDITFYDGESL